MTSKIKKLTLFDELLIDLDIELKEALAISRYKALTREEQDAIKEGSETIRESFLALDSALLYINVGQLPGTNSIEDDADAAGSSLVSSRTHRQEALSPCRDAIKCLVRFFGLTMKRDPRTIIKSSTYSITRKEIRLTPSRE